MTGTPRKITIEDYFDLFEDGDDGKIEFIRGEMWIGGSPAYEFVVRYLAKIGEEPRPITP